MSTRRNEGASTGHGDGNNGYKYSKKGCKWDLNDIEDDISGEMDGEVKERKELKRKRNLEVETAVAMLLGLAKSDGAHFSTHNDTENCSNTFPEIREGSNDQRIKVADSDLTRKGSLRLGPGDNRVRPPKAATKLLPHAKWRHIRLPDVVSALEAEDWVVMFVHFKYPELLSKSKAESMLNFRMAHYDEHEMQSSFETVKDTSELENFLKDKYGGNTGHRRQRSVPHFETELPSNVNGRAAFVEQKKSMNDTSRILKARFPDFEMIREAEIGTKDGLHAKVMNDHLNIQTAFKETESLLSLPDEYSRANGEKINMATTQILGKRTDCVQSPSKSGNEHEKKRLEAVTQDDGHGNIGANAGGSTRSLGGQTLPLLHCKDSTDNLRLESPYSKRGVFGKNHQEGLFPFGNWSPILAAAYWPMAKKNILGFHLPGSPARCPTHITSEANGNNSHVECSEKPGRPPSYDDMVQWCVHLKRTLSKRHVPLTIDEAVNLVNDTEFHQGILKDARSKILVASTLRKRVLGLYGLTWSQIATAHDPESSKVTSDPSILAASDKMFRKHGLNSYGYSGENASQIPCFVPRVNIRDGTGGAATNLSAEVEGKREPETLVKIRNEAEKYHMDTFAVDKPADPPMGSKESVNPTTWQIGKSPICLSSSLPHISSPLKDLLDKAKTSFLASEEVAKILEEGAGDKLPLSETVGYHPPSGCMYIFDRSKTIRFRSDGYEWTKRETHAKRKLANNRKLNCYYSGGPNDKLQRRCYWILEGNGTKEDFEKKLTNLVFVHYLDAAKEGKNMKKLDLMVESSLNCATGNNNSQPLSVMQLISDVDLLDSESMFNSLCSFHRLKGLSKEECTNLCRMWMENKLDEKQKRQMFVFIKNNAEDTEAVVHWLKKICAETY